MLHIEIRGVLPKENLMIHDIDDGEIPGEVEFDPASAERG